MDQKFKVLTLQCPKEIYFYKLEFNILKILFL